MIFLINVGKCQTFPSAIYTPNRVQCPCTYFKAICKSQSILVDIMELAVLNIHTLLTIYNTKSALLRKITSLRNTIFISHDLLIILST